MSTTFYSTFQTATTTQLVGWFTLGPDNRLSFSASESWTLLKGHLIANLDGPSLFVLDGSRTVFEGVFVD